jgi:hypothetical protein
MIIMMSSLSLWSQTSFFSDKTDPLTREYIIKRMKVKNTNRYLMTGGFLCVGVSSIILGDRIMKDIDESEPSGFIGIDVLSALGMYGLSKVMTYSGIAVTIMSVTGLMKCAVETARIHQMQLEIRDMSVAGKPGIGIGINLDLNTRVGG